MSADDQNGSIGPNSDVTTPHVLVTPRRLGHSFRNGIQQDMTRERLAQIGDAPGIHRLIACGRVVVRRHEDDRALRSRYRKSALQLDPRSSSEMDAEQQAGCRLRATAFEQRLRGGERPAFDAIVRQQPHHAPQKARIVNRPRSRLSVCAAISVSSPGAVCVADP